MSILKDLRTAEELQIAAALPDSALLWLCRPLSAEDIYVHEIRKSKGRFRRVYEPRDNSLARLLKQLKEFLDRQVFQPHANVHGFIRDRSIFTNATAHLGARAILAVDISDFFSSISRDQITGALISLGASDQVAVSIANVCTFRNELVTGLSTSPVLSNLVFLPLDKNFESLAVERGLTYSRYADDLTFSGDAVDDQLLAVVAERLSEHGFKINLKKVRFMRKGHRQVVTGVSVACGDKLRLPRNFKKRIRQDLYFSEKNGISLQALHRGFSNDEDFRESLKGKINHLNSVDSSAAKLFMSQLNNISS
ncbi:hypothetical protein BHE16_04285 [Neomicrococcus aestuarii]|uniref:RNA-directed DNA polymerase n=1 Tax=Neomicrococcus aestuarii TaxID=556325 RepID=A0A1L2ZMM3_9MICC|nr:hypothetical protein BHE16_04285 [Neomicrococcus aestuarii]